MSWIDEFMEQNFELDTVFDKLDQGANLEDILDEAIFEDAEGLFYDLTEGLYIALEEHEDMNYDLVAMLTHTRNQRGQIVPEVYVAELRNEYAANPSIETKQEILELVETTAIISDYGPLIDRLGGS